MFVFFGFSLYGMRWCNNIGLLWQVDEVDLSMKKNGLSMYVSIYITPFFPSFIALYYNEKYLGASWAAPCNLLKCSSPFVKCLLFFFSEYLFLCVIGLSYINIGASQVVYIKRNLNWNNYKIIEMGVKSSLYKINCQIRWKWY